jgi:hypothetical protein
MGDEEGPEFTVEYLDGDMEVTNWLKRGGKAKVTYPNGDIYEGFFNEARQKHGQGHYTWIGGNDEENEDEDAPKGGGEYWGDYAAGKKHGIGRIRYANGDTYHGMWFTDMKHGEGTYIYANGDIYSGQWNRGVKNGRGTYVFVSNDTQLIGTWVDGKITAGKWAFKDGTCFNGDFVNNRPRGAGLFTFKSGNEQAGEWIERVVGDDEETELVWKGGPVMKSKDSIEEYNRPGGPVDPVGPAPFVEEKKGEDEEEEDE